MEKNNCGLRNSANWCELHICDAKHWRKTLCVNDSASPIVGMNQFWIEDVSSEEEKWSKKIQ